MSVSLVARRYAQALLELGTAQGQLDALVEELGTLGDAWEASPELRNAIENPLGPHAAKKGVVTELATKINASPTTRNTLLLLVDRRRAPALPYIARTLRELA